MNDTPLEADMETDMDVGADERVEGSAPSTPDEPTAETDEADILRTELSRLQSELSEAKTQADEMKNRFLRARADLENYRRRSAQDLERARESGLDSAVLTVLTVYDDLGRALEAADQDDPSKIIPGVEGVRTALKRNLEALGIREVGHKGDPFDPDLHEALSAAPTDDPALIDTIAEVYQMGFIKGERLVRPARVVVYRG